MGNYIDDGYTIKETLIPPKDSGLSPMTIERRPVNAAQREAALNEQINATRKANETNREPDLLPVLAEQIARQLVAWDVTKRDGVAVPVSTENVGKLDPRWPPVLWDRIYGKASLELLESDQKN